jgi:acetyltransferase-like isoleucine patch superfamily enzyme
MSKNWINCTFGKDCVISENADLRNVVCGDGVIISDNVSLNNVRIGDGSKIARRVVMYSPDPLRPVLIGKDVQVSFGVFAEGTGGQIRIGDYSGLGHFSVLLTGSGMGSKSPVMDALFPMSLGDLVVGDHDWIGAHTIMLPGAELPEGVIIASNTTVRKADYEPWTIYGGSPAKLIRKIDQNKVIELKKQFGL